MNRSRQVSEVDSNPNKRWASNYFLAEVCDVTYEVKKSCQMELLVAQSCPTLCNLMDCNPPGPSVTGIFQARILEWAAIPFSRRSSQLRDWTQVSYIAGRLFTIWATSEALSSKLPCKTMRLFPFGIWRNRGSEWLRDSPLHHPYYS